MDGTCPPPQHWNFPISTGLELLHVPSKLQKCSAFLKSCPRQEQGSEQLSLAVRTQFLQSCLVEEDYLVLQFLQPDSGRAFRRVSRIMLCHMLLWVAWNSLPSGICQCPGDPLVLTSSCVSWPQWLFFLEGCIKHSTALGLTRTARVRV